MQLFFGLRPQGCQLHDFSRGSLTFCDIADFATTYFI